MNGGIMNISKAETIEMYERLKIEKMEELKHMGFTDDEVEEMITEVITSNEKMLRDITVYLTPFAKLKLNYLNN